MLSYLKKEGWGKERVVEAEWGRERVVEEEWGKESEESRGKSVG